MTLILSHLPLSAKASVTAASPTSSVVSEETGLGKAETAAEAEPAYIDLQNSFGNTALHWACLGGHLDIVKLLLSRGASPTIANDKDQIPLDLAAFNNHMHVVDYFLSTTKDMEGKNAQEGGLENGAQDLDMTQDARDDTAEITQSGG